MIRWPRKRETRPLEPKIDGQPQTPGAPDSQADPRGDLPRQALGRGGDDPDEARREELEQGELARRGGAMAKRVLPG